jgi:uncharacterized YccA/Bax inhibitor family protein
MVSRSANPALNKNTFITTGRAGTSSNVMTIEGTVNKTALLLGLLLVTASYSWSNQSVLLLTGGAIGGLIMAFVTIFKKEWSGFTAPVYALFEGLFLGSISAMFERSYPGIVTNAVLLTFGTLFALLIAYRSGVIKATENFKLGVFAATGGIFFLYMISIVLGFFGISIPFMHSNGPIGIGISLVIVVIAALNLVLDFDFIEQGSELGAPKYMEWYGAFGLMVTLIWLYIEILHLLSKLQSRD